ncbi:hypothetical protein SAMN05421823_108278 [Catalinimonas alkaloidigena]|uniref:Lipocalin-like domain-containing protein n=1 Tax=Catalinimonas alkaloidigena TaxID=1075417 RepID=A0A1G9NGM1_9BACT|nr:hypothetical protein [Catalinimonas alkaloidigena]SDL85217.1 hypothetical protein SAMN05421823_108278 [Catalinimonas alkaloidigena]
MRTFCLCLLLCLGLSACQHESIDPNRLLGSWNGGGVVYTFEADGSFTATYPFTGYAEDTILASSLWGLYTTDDRRNNVEMRALGYVGKSGEVIQQPLKQVTWSYSFPNDTTLRYESRTAIGYLYRTP